MENYFDIVRVKKLDYVDLFYFVYICNGFIIVNLI